MLGHSKKTLGQKISGDFSRLGNKVSREARLGVKWGVQHSGDIADISGKISTGAEVLAPILASAGAGLAATGVGLPLAAGLEGLAGATETVGLGAKYVNIGATSVSKAKESGLIPKSYGG